VPTINQLIRKGKKQGACSALYNEHHETTTLSAAHGRAAEAWSLHGCENNDAKEAELGSAKNRSCSFDEWY
jgi:hypothetical protein